jgi:hypothetical protein
VAGFEDETDSTHEQVARSNESDSAARLSPCVTQPFLRCASRHEFGLSGANESETKDSSMLGSAASLLVAGRGASGSGWVGRGPRLVEASEPVSVSTGHRTGTRSNISNPKRS